MLLLSRVSFRFIFRLRAGLSVRVSVKMKFRVIFMYSIRVSVGLVLVSV